MKTSQFALNVVSLNRQADLEAHLAATAEAGFTKVELTWGEAKQYVQQPGGVDRLRKQLDKLGLKVIGGFENGVCAFGDAAAKQREAQTVIANARLLDELGGGVIVCGSDGPAKRSLDAIPVLGRQLAEVAEACPVSVKLALECNWSAVAWTTKANVRVCEAANHPRVGMLFDPAHYHVHASKLDDFTPRVVRQIIHVHVNNMRDKPGEYCDCNADRLLPGDPDGAIDLKALFGRIEQHGYRGDFSIEMFSDELWALPARDAAARMYQAMKTLL